MNEFDLDIDATIEKLNIPGIQIGLIVDGKVIFSRGYGSRNLAEDKPMAEDTSVGIGSLSKSFATYILCQLVSEGKISWDDPAYKYVPEFQLSDPNSTKKITILDLAAHRTGIFRHDALWYLSDRSKLSPIDAVKLLPLLGAECKPRESFQYNNLMYSVIGLIIERVTGISYEEAVSKRILMPLGMVHTGFSHRPINYSLPYACIEGKIQEVPFQYIPAVSVGGGMYSTALDILKWAQFHLEKKTLMEEMYTVQMPFQKSPEGDIHDLGYGLGWFIGKYRGFEYIRHEGLANGFTAHLSFFPQKNSGLVILTNSSSDGISAINFIQQTIIDKILGLNSNHSLPEVKPLLNEEKILETVPSQPLQEYVGDYNHPAYGLIKVRLIESQLTLFYSQMPISLSPTGDNQFLAKLTALQKFGVSPWLEVSFSMNSAEKISMIQVPFEAFRSGKPVIFTKE